MSYDVTVGADSLNYTSNMRRFFADFGVYPPDWHGRNRHAVGREITAALAKIERADRDALRAEYDAANGWGRVDTAIGFLRKVRNECVRELPDDVKVWW